MKRSSLLHGMANGGRIQLGRRILLRFVDQPIFFVWFFMASLSSFASLPSSFVVSEVDVGSNAGILALQRHDMMA